MNKTSIKNFAIWARNKLIADIIYQAGLLGVTEKGIASALPQSTREVQFFDIGTKDYMTVRGKAVQQREAFVAAIKAKQADAVYADAFRFVVEKVAYTWFNRLIAIRFMEVNDYLPGRVRVLSSENPGKAEPDMVTRPFDTDLSFSAQEQDEIMRMKDENKLDELFRMLFVKQCHKLHEVLPNLFEEGGIQREDSYLELLLTISFTDKDGVLWHLTHDISEDDFYVEKEGQVEIIGWMYQYYNTEPKDQVFADLKKNIKIGKDNIPAATQLFTPDWIVRYMVQNSLGRLWVEGHPNTKDRFMPKHNADGSVCMQEGRWNYYLEEAKQAPQVEVQLQAIREEYAHLRAEDIKVIDPCCGSGHIAVYLFDVLMQIYETQGWTQREAAQSIVEHNLFALDIDDRAAQLAYFAVMMKARQYDRRFFERGIQPHVYAVPEWDEVTREDWSTELKNLCNLLRDGKELGSIIDMPDMDWDALRNEVLNMNGLGQISVLDTVSEETQEKLRQLIDVGQVMARKYDVIVTNPPYMNNGNMDSILLNFIKQNYPVSKVDLFSVFIERCQEMAKNKGFIAMITMQSWMFLGSFAGFRKKTFIDNYMITLLHLGIKAFEEIGNDVVQTSSFIMNKTKLSEYVGVYFRLLTHNRNEKSRLYLERKNKFEISQKRFESIPGQPIAYWVSELFLSSFSYKKIGDYASTNNGFTTGDNNLFIRLWFEIERDKILFNCSGLEEAKESGAKWFPYNKGGDFRKWYGNNEYVINYENDGKEIKAYGHLVPRSLKYQFCESGTWNKINTGTTGFRYKARGTMFDVGGLSLFPYDRNMLFYIIALCNSVYTKKVLEVLSPTLNCETGHVSSIPVIISDRKKEIDDLAKDSIEISKDDWDSFEVSWGFQRHPLIAVESDISFGQFAQARMKAASRLEARFQEWTEKCERRFQRLKANEEELNRIFIHIYGLQDELTPEVENKYVTVRRADLGRDIRSLISYAVGCMLGRYSLDAPGLVYAGGVWDSSKYSSYQPDPDNCIPITDEPYFEDDIVGRFEDFIRTVYDADTLEENLDFIAKALGNKGNTSREVIRNYFLNDFFKDHCATYSVTGSGKRPIYWLFESGKQNGFKALVYMHRWSADTVGNLRVEYLHRMQRVYEKEIERMQDIIDNSRDNREVNQASKRREKLVMQLKEVRDYDAKIAHVALSRVEIDLDDGVKVNYEKVQKGPDGKSLGILAKI